MKINKSTTSHFQTPNPQEIWIDEGIFVREIINHPDHPAFSLARCRLPVGKTTQLHKLDVDETYSIEDGTGLMRIDQEECSVKTGDNIFVPKGTPQSITNTGKTDLIFLVICTPRFTISGYEAV